MVKTFARFSVFARGRIVGKAEEGAKEKNIQSSVKKTNGKRGSLRAIRAIIKHSRDDPRRSRVDAASRPRGGRGAAPASWCRAQGASKHVSSPHQGCASRPHRGGIEAALRPHRGRIEAAQARQCAFSSDKQRGLRSNPDRTLTVH